MTLKVAIQMDPIEAVNIESDTTFLMAETAQARGTGCGSMISAPWPLRRGGSTAAPVRSPFVARPATTSISATPFGWTWGRTSMWS